MTDTRIVDAVLDAIECEPAEAQQIAERIVENVVGAIEDGYRGLNRKTGDEIFISSDWLVATLEEIRDLKARPPAERG